MATNKIRLDSAGINEVLNSSAVLAELQDMGAGVEAGAIGETANGEPVPVESYVRQVSGGRLKGSRPGVDVVLAHPAGLRIEAKRGTLTRAASAAGLETKARPIE